MGRNHTIPLFFRAAVEREWTRQNEGKYIQDFASTLAETQFAKAGMFRRLENLQIQYCIQEDLGRIKTWTDIDNLPNTFMLDLEDFNVRIFVTDFRESIRGGRLWREDEVDGWAVANTVTGQQSSWSKAKHARKRGKLRR